MSKCQKGEEPGKGACCCNCAHHLKLMSHPWVNDLPITHQVGWVCIAFNDMEKAGAGGPGGAEVCQGHGMCELHMTAEEG